MLESLPGGGVREIPPDECSGCDETRLRPGWGECPACGKMGREYRCSRDHITMASWHVHGVLPSESRRWPCGWAEGDR